MSFWLSPVLEESQMVLLQITWHMSMKKVVVLSTCLQQCRGYRKKHDLIVNGNISVCMCHT